MSYINNNYFKHGSWNVICDVCGVRHKADQVRKRWDGLIVCAEDWETDHPQKFIRVQSDPKPVRFVRSEPEDTFRFVCTPRTSAGLADHATADCGRADQTMNFDFLSTVDASLHNAIAGLAIAGLAIAGVTYE